MASNNIKIISNMKTTNGCEHPYTGAVLNGFAMLAYNFVLLCVGILSIVACEYEQLPYFFGAPVFILCMLAYVVLLFGFFSQQPNQSRVIIFFGKYKGTFDKVGFFWINPFCNRRKMSLRIRNMDIDPIKVNDKIGNPVLIGMVLVWKVCDTYKAVFDVDSDEPVVVQDNNGKATLSASSRDKALTAFVRIQGDAALREVTGHYAYDDSDSTAEGELTLRSGGEEINERLERKINERLSMAGIEVVEARINYLAYAPEIAAVMLRRQQASAIISAREKIVEGAVTMVKMALDRLDEQDVVALDDERKAAMVSNLLVVLCADEAAQPVVNTGSIYQ